MKIVLILRSIPGGGKSTFANMLLNSIKGTVAIHSTDTKHMVNGEYRWDASKVREYHQQNFEEFIQSLRNGVELVIVDNTNLAHREYAHYLAEGKSHGYYVYSVVFEPSSAQTHFERNTHSVPMATIEAMLGRFVLDTPGVDGQFLIPAAFGPIRDEVIGNAVRQIEQVLHNVL